MPKHSPVVGPHPETGIPTEWPMVKVAAAAWGVSSACVGKWLQIGRDGWSYADGRAPERRMGAKCCAACGETFHQRQDEMGDQFRQRRSCSEACRRELVGAAKRGRQWSTACDPCRGQPVSTIDRKPLTPDDGRYWI